MQGQFYLVTKIDEIPIRITAFGRALRENWNGDPVCWKAEKYVPPRSQDQNALLHVWCEKYACHLLNKAKVSSEEKEAMKYTLQRHCYADMSWSFLITQKTDLFTGESKPDRASTTKFKRGEMFDYMCWIQAKAANDGLILESTGEYLMLKEKENG